jgi:hypothetical protein
MIKRCPKLEFCVAPLGDNLIWENEGRRYSVISAAFVDSGWNVPSLPVMLRCLLFAPPQINFLKTYKFDKMFTKA